MAEFRFERVDTLPGWNLRCSGERGTSIPGMIRDGDLPGLALAALRALPDHTRLAAIREAARESGVVTLTADAAAAMVADEAGEPASWAALSGAYLSLAEQVGRPELADAIQELHETVQERLTEIDAFAPPEP